MTEHNQGVPGGQPPQQPQQQQATGAEAPGADHTTSAEPWRAAGPAATTPAPETGAAVPTDKPEQPEQQDSGQPASTGQPANTDYSSQSSQQQNWGQPYPEQPYPGQPAATTPSSAWQPGGPPYPGQPGGQPGATTPPSEWQPGSQPGVATPSSVWQPASHPVATTPASSWQPGETTPSSAWQPGEAAPPGAWQQGAQGQVPPGPHAAGMPHTAAPPQVGPPMGTQQFGVPSGPKRGLRGKIVAGAAVLALVVGGASGGVGGVIGYNLAHQNPTQFNSLNMPLPPANPASAPGSISQVAQKVLPSVVELQVQGATASGDGSGIIISPDGMILTNNHVVTDAVNGGQITVVFQDGKTTPATIVGTAPNMDLAVVKAQNVSGLTQAELGTSSNLIVGQQVVAIGSPFGLNGTVTSGIVSALNRPVKAGGPTGPQQSVLDAVQTDAPINPGNSGGPLVNMQGQVIGINSAIYSPQTSGGQAGSVGLGFSIPIDQARRIAQQLVTTGKATEALLGVSVKSGSGGAQVAAVTPGGAADGAGIKMGDVITKLDTRLIPDMDTLVAAVRAHAPGEQVKVTLGDGRVLTATLGSTTG